MRRKLHVLVGLIFPQNRDRSDVSPAYRRIFGRHLRFSESKAGFALCKFTGNGIFKSLLVGRILIKCNREASAFKILRKENVNGKGSVGRKVGLTDVKFHSRADTVGLSHGSEGLKTNAVIAFGNKLLFGAFCRNGGVNFLNFRIFKAFNHKIPEGIDSLLLGR